MDPVQTVGATQAEFSSPILSNLDAQRQRPKEVNVFVQLMSMSFVSHRLWHVTPAEPMYDACPHSSPELYSTHIGESSQRAIQPIDHMYAFLLFQPNRYAPNFQCQAA